MDLVLYKVGIWEHDGLLGIYNTQGVFTCLDKNGSIITRVVPESENIRFVGINWKAVSKKLKKVSREREAFLAFEDLYFSVRDILEVTVLSDYEDTLTTYRRDEDELEVVWDSIPLHLVYSAILEGDWKVETSSVRETISRDDIQQLLLLPLSVGIDPHTICVARRILRRLEQDYLIYLDKNSA